MIRARIPTRTLAGFASGWARSAAGSSTPKGAKAATAGGVGTSGADAAGLPASAAVTATAEAGGSGAVLVAAATGAGATAVPAPGEELATRFVHCPSQYRYS